MNSRHEHAKIDGEAKIISFPEGILGFSNLKLIMAKQIPYPIVYNLVHVEISLSP